MTSWKLDDKRDTENRFRILNIIRKASSFEWRMLT